jgi:hypothetical protein
MKALNMNDIVSITITYHVYFKLTKVVGNKVRRTNIFTYGFSFTSAVHDYISDTTALIPYWIRLAMDRAVITILSKISIGIGPLILNELRLV